MTIGNLMLNGAGSIQHTGSTLLISHPESGSLFTEYLRAATRSAASAAAAYRIRGRSTAAHRDERRLPLVDPTGGSSTSSSRALRSSARYDSTGTLIFERHIEGRELDDYLAVQPKRWPRREVQERRALRHAVDQRRSRQRSR